MLCWIKANTYIWLWWKYKSTVCCFCIRLCIQVIICAIKILLLNINSIQCEYNRIPQLCLYLFLIRVEKFFWPLSRVPRKTLLQGNLTEEGWEWPLPKRHHFQSPSSIARDQHVARFSSGQTCWHRNLNVSLYCVVGRLLASPSFLFYKYAIIIRPNILLILFRALSTHKTDTKYSEFFLTM